jgi:nicotinate-nucleotide adenylyltransferase
VTALLGGAFDPPHVGHVALLDRVRVYFRPERLVVLVVADPGHRQVHAETQMRLELARAAFPGAEVEVDRHARTVDMLREGLYPDPLFIVGADELAGFLSWKEPDEVLRLARLAVATRPGYPRERLDAVLERLQKRERVLFFELEPIPVSSSEVRERVARGEPIDGLVPAPVARAIVEFGLYRG